MGGAEYFPVLTSDKPPKPEPSNASSSNLSSPDNSIMDENLLSRPSTPDDDARTMARGTLVSLTAKHSCSS
jgi:hypothetical protein